MKLSRCPVCHSNLHLDALTNDEAAKEILSMLAPMDGGFARALVAYIALFRPAKSDLSFSRALKLSKEVLQLSPNKDWLSYQKKYCNYHPTKIGYELPLKKPSSSYNKQEAKASTAN